MASKIVLCTAGGHISCFHAAMKAMLDTLRNKSSRLELYGAKGGIQGLNGGKLTSIFYQDVDEDRAGSMIGADRNHVNVEKIKWVVKKEDILAIVMMGGDNHLREANELAKAGINVVGYPKTMDGDLSSLITLGYDTAVSVGANAVRIHHNTAITNGKVFYVGLFGRDTDWVPCAVSAYGGADRCIPCEKSYSWEEIWQKIDSSVKENKENCGVGFAVVPFSEGAKINEIPNPPEEFCERDTHGEVKLRPEWVAMNLELLTKKRGGKSCSQMYTYSMRDSPPTKTDKKLSAMAGRECIEMILEGEFGKCVAFSPLGDFYNTERKPLEEVAVKRRLKDTGYFDYEELRSNHSFVRDYGNLFRNSLGKVSSKKSLVYRNMLR